MTTMTQSTTSEINEKTRISMSQPKLFSHLNGLALFIGSVVAFGVVSGDWLAFILLLLVPDLFMLGYMANTKIGAWIYNFGHSYVLAIPVIVVGVALDHNTILSIGIILMAHIGMDQVAGYGYKYGDAEFSHTHMNRI